MRKIIIHKAQIKKGLGIFVVVLLLFMDGSLTVSGQVFHNKLLTPERVSFSVKLHNSNLAISQSVKNELHFIEFNFQNPINIAITFCAFIFLILLLLAFSNKKKMLLTLATKGRQIELQKEKILELERELAQDIDMIKTLEAARNKLFSVITIVR